MAKKTIETIQSPELSIGDIISRLKTLTRYDAQIEGGCECCGTWIEHTECKSGDWVKYEDIESLLKELK